MPNGVRSNPADPVIARSQALYSRATGLIPAVTQTLAKGPGQFVEGVAPKYLARGRGSHVWDVDGNEYLDYSMAVGPLSLGYANPAVDAAIATQLRSGITFSLMHPLEVEVAGREVPLGALFHAHARPRLRPCPAAGRCPGLAARGAGLAGRGR